MSAADKDAAMRAEFHKAARKQFGEMGLLNLNGVYAYHEVNTAWWAWQAATRRVGAREAELVDLLRGAMAPDLLPLHSPEWLARVERMLGAVRMLAHADGQVHDVVATPRAGVPHFTGLMLDAADQLERQGTSAGFFTLADYNTNEEPCKN